MTKLEVDCLLLSIEKLCIDDVKYHKQFPPKEERLVTQTILNMIKEVRYSTLSQSYGECSDERREG